jgi:hypothetical protein
MHRSRASEFLMHPSVFGARPGDVGRWASATIVGSTSGE